MNCPPDHKHGATSTCYGTHGCRCLACRRFNADDQLKRRKQVAYGRPTTDLVDAAPVRAHVEALRAAGMGQGRIADVSGVPKNIIRHLLYGTYHAAPAARMRAANAAALLAVEATPETTYLRDGRGVHRRLQALAWQGWTFARIADRLSIRTEAVHSYLESPQVTNATHDRITALFAELWDQQPPEGTRGEHAAAARMRSLARRKGWVGPLGWDDIDADDTPPEVPKPTRAATRAMREVEIERLHGFRYGDKRIAAELGMHPREVFRIRGEMGLPAWTREQQKEAA